MNKSGLSDLQSTKIKMKYGCIHLHLRQFKIVSNSIYPVPKGMVILAPTTILINSIESSFIIPKPVAFFAHR